jgi:hypothetical protein
VNKNTTRKGKREIQINSDFWRAVIEQAWYQPGIEHHDE